MIKHLLATGFIIGTFSFAASAAEQVNDIDTQDESAIAHELIEEMAEFGAIISESENETFEAQQRWRRRPPRYPYRPRPRGQYCMVAGDFDYGSCDLDLASNYAEHSYVPPGTRVYYRDNSGDYQGEGEYVCSRGYLRLVWGYCN